MSELQEALTEPERETLIMPSEPWTDEYALKICRSDFEYAKNFRESNHDPRWNLADQLYFGYERQRVWKGTKIPRSSLGMFVVFQQIESMLPKVLSTIFADNPWFEVGPQPGTSAQVAIDVRNLMMYQMELARKYQNQSVREVFRRGIKSGFLYGNGIVEICWMDFIRDIRKLVRQIMPETDPMGLPTGRLQSVIGQQMTQKHYQFPYLKNISIKDFYVDPNLECPQIQAGSYAFKTSRMSAADIKALAEKDERFTIPDDKTLLELCNKKLQTPADSAKQWAESTRSVDYNPEVDSSEDPASLRGTVINRWSPDRSVWTINNDVVIFNQKNDYQFTPFFNAFYTDAPDRFYGVSVTDVTEGEHRLQGAIVNGRVDELSLTLHGTTVKKRGFSIPNSQLQRRPGQIIEAESPKEDIVFQPTQNITQNAFVEVAASELRVQKTTGITDLAVMGVQSSGGNSANRTATGVGAQVQAAFSRITYLIENLEDTFVEPILSAFHELNTKYLDPQELLEFMGPDGASLTLDPLTILNAEVLFTMRASSKMQSRMALMQQFPALAQAMLNPRLIEALNAQGQTVDLAEFFAIFVDATGYKMRGQVVRLMSAEEQRAYQASKMQEPMALVMQRERFKDMESLQDKKHQDEMEMLIAEKAMDSALEPEEKPENAEA